MTTSRYLLLVLAGLWLTGAEAQHAGHDDHNAMQVTATGVVMNENRDRLPNGCAQISGEEHFVIHAGRRYAQDLPGVMFGMSQHEVRVQPCSRVTIEFVNEDDTRHQWMVHGLPKYLYPAGMFHIEAMGGQRQSGTFIVPAEDRNYLIHCDMAQHMEKGMRGQLVVGAGSGDLWAVTGISDAFRRSTYLPGNTALLVLLTVAGAFLLGRWRYRGPRS
jgi:plastocyanin